MLVSLSARQALLEFEADVSALDADRSRRAYEVGRAGFTLFALTSAVAMRARAFRGARRQLYSADMLKEMLMAGIGCRRER